jgi:hypothetical protein
MTTRGGGGAQGPAGGGNGLFGFLRYLTGRLFDLLDVLFKDSQKSWAHMGRALAALWTFILGAAFIVALVRRPAGGLWQELISLAAKAPTQAAVIVAVVGSIVLVTTTVNSLLSRRRPDLPATRRRNAKKASVPLQKEGETPNEEQPTSGGSGGGAG